MPQHDLVPLLSRTDRLLAGLDTLLRGIAAPARKFSRPSPADELPDGPLTAGERKHAAGLMRVNHAGEVAAQGLYEGHAALARTAVIYEHMLAAADEERDHLGWCEQRLDELGAGPSILRPLWYAGAFSIGAVSAVLGDRWSLGFVDETERQVAEHLAGHLERLPPGDARSREIVRTMRAEELEHGARARAAGGHDLPRPIRQLMRMTARVMTATSYRI